MLNISKNHISPGTPRWCCAFGMVTLFAGSAAFAEPFCDEINAAVVQGKSNFAQSKGSRVPEFSEGSNSVYGSNLEFAEFPSVERLPGCVLESFDTDRPALLTLSCDGQKKATAAEAKDLYQALTRELTECIRVHFPNALGPVSGSRGQNEYQKFSHVAETTSGWQLGIELSYRVSNTKRGPGYSVNLELSPE
jgi:hypothetical protein